MLDRYYVGETMDMEVRLQQHRSGFYKGSYTKQTKDWELKVSIPFSSITKAKKAENFVKRMNSRKFIEKLIVDHQWLIARFEGEGVGS